MDGNGCKKSVFEHAVGNRIGQMLKGFMGLVHVGFCTGQLYHHGYVGVARMARPNPDIVCRNGKVGGVVGKGIPQLYHIANKVVCIDGVAESGVTDKGFLHRHGEFPLKVR